MNNMFKILVFLGISGISEDEKYKEIKKQFQDKSVGLATLIEVLLRGVTTAISIVVASIVIGPFFIGQKYFINPLAQTIRTLDEKIRVRV